METSPGYPTFFLLPILEEKHHEVLNQYWILCRRGGMVYAAVSDTVELVSCEFDSRRLHQCDYGGTGIRRRLRTVVALCLSGFESR